MDFGEWGSPPGYDFDFDTIDDPAPFSFDFGDVDSPIEISFFGEDLSLDVIVDSVNLEGSLGARTPIDPSAISRDRYSFPTPAGTLVLGVGLQKFVISLRRFGGFALPTVSVRLFEVGGSIPLVEQTGIEVSSDDPDWQTVEFMWDAALLSQISGTDVELEVEIAPS